MATAIAPERLRALLLDRGAELLGKLQLKDLDEAVDLLELQADQAELLQDTGHLRLHPRPPLPAARILQARADGEQKTERGDACCRLRPPLAVRGRPQRPLASCPRPRPTRPFGS